MLMHHAYYIEGPLSRFAAYKEELKPFVAEKHERFGIDEARALIALAALKNFSQALFFVAASSMTSEAQQALLKLFEEPQQGTVFVLLVPHGTLLPTLRSRMLELPRQTASQKVLGSPVSAKSAEAGRPDHFAQQSAALFLKVSGKERSDLAAQLLKDEEGVRERVLEFVNALEALLAKDIKKNAQALQDIGMTRDYLRDRSPSFKILLEHLVLSLPVV